MERSKIQHWTVPNEKLENDDGWQVRAHPRLVTAVKNNDVRGTCTTKRLVFRTVSIESTGTCYVQSPQVGTCLRVLLFFTQKSAIFQSCDGQKHSHFCAKISEDSLLERHGMRRSRPVLTLENARP